MMVMMVMVDGTDCDDDHVDDDDGNCDDDMVDCEYAEHPGDGDDDAIGDDVGDFACYTNNGVTVVMVAIVVMIMMTMLAIMTQIRRYYGSW